MTAFEKPSFSVNPSAAKAPTDCKHGWVDEKRERCVLCGAKVDCAPYGLPAHERERRMGFTHVNLDCLAQR